MFTRKDLLILVAAVVLLMLIPGTASAQDSIPPLQPDACSAFEDCEITEYTGVNPCDVQPDAIECLPSEEPVAENDIDPELERFEHVLREFTVDDVAYVIYEDGSGTIVSGSEAIGFCIHSGICYNPPLAPPVSGDVVGSAVAPFDTIFDAESTTWMVYSDGYGTAMNGEEVMDFYTKDHYSVFMPSLSK
jgi:hypothetical protein